MVTKIVNWFLFVIIVISGLEPTRITKQDTIVEFFV